MSRAAALALLAAHSLLAQSPIPGPPTEMEAVKQLRSQFQIQVLAQSQTLTEQYERALARLELELAEAGDYEQALQVKQRRDQIQTLYRDSDSAALAAGLAIPLPAAQFRGSGVALQDDGALAGWRSSSHFAEWTSVKITPGEYFLEFDYLMLPVPQANPSAAGNAEPKALLEFYGVSLLAGAAENRLGFELQLARNSATYTSFRAGPLRYTRPPGTLRLAASRSYPGNIIRIKNLRLVPAPAPVQTTATANGQPAATAPATPPAAGIPELREALAAELVNAFKPIHENHIARLQDLAARQPGWQPYIDAELRAHQRRLSIVDKKTGPSASLPLPKPIATLGGIAGFQDMEEVTFVPHPDNTGDRFRVRHQDQEFFIRLLWLRCAPPTPAGAEVDPGPFSRHFGIPAEDAALFGRAASEFTAGYLEAKTFRLLARNTTDPDDTLPALVFLDDIGLYHHILIDQGLAAVTGRPGSGGTLERAFLRSLLDREAEARRRDPRPGAWALSATPTAP